MAKDVGSVIRTAIKRTFNLFGLELVRIKNVPKLTLAGLKDRRIRSVIDVGANRGQFARYISGFFPNATLFCFEPLTGPFQDLSYWAASQGNHVRCSNVALGESEGTVILHHHIKHDTSSSLLPTTDHKLSLFPDVEEQADIEVPLTTLDTVLGETLEDMDGEVLLKLDVQGYEDRVLRGARQVLQRVDICILEASVDPLYASQAAFKDLVVYLDECGLVYAGNLEQACSEDGRIMWLDALFVRQSG